jgi:hypothetical protein
MVLIMEFGFEGAGLNVKVQGCRQVIFGYKL